MLEKVFKLQIKALCLDLGTNSFESPASEVLSDPRIQELYLGKRRNTAGYGGTQMIQVIQIINSWCGIGRRICPHVIGHDPDFWRNAHC